MLVTKNDVHSMSVVNHRCDASRNFSTVRSRNVSWAICFLSFVLGCNEAIAGKRSEALGSAAKWIGLDGTEQTNWLETAYAGFEDQTTSLSWIWSPQGQAEKAADPGTFYFRRVIVVPDSKPAVKEVHFQFAGDSECRAWLNGVDLGSKRGFHEVKDVDVTYHLNRGTNVLCLMGVGTGTSTEPFGVVASMEVEFVRGDTFSYWTDQDWKVSDHAPEGWTAMDFDDSKWMKVKVLGLVGMEPWGKIRTRESRQQPARYLRKDFVVEKKLKKAVVSFCGLGWSELYLNGRKVGNDVLSPAIGDYAKQVFFLTYDVKEQLEPGTNTLGAILGNGMFYAPRSEVVTGKPSAGWPKMRLQLRLEYADGTVKEVVSDESWLLTIQGPIRANNVYDGEECDANFDLGNWNRPGYTAARFDVATDSGTQIPASQKRWQAAQIVAAPTGKLIPQQSKPLRVAKTSKPGSCTEPQLGVYIFDMGRDIAGWCQLKVKGPALTKIVLRYGAKLKQDGSLDLTESDGVKATDSYVLRGEGLEVWEPRFTCHRFHYVEVTGYPGKPPRDAIVARVLSEVPKGF